MRIGARSIPIAMQQFLQSMIEESIFDGTDASIRLEELNGNQVFPGRNTVLMRAFGRRLILAPKRSGPFRIGRRI